MQKVIFVVYSNAKVCEARFISEGKTRFICNVDYQGKSIECYVPNTCKLSKLIHLNNNDVLITKNLHETNRTQYTLFAIKVCNEYLIVNTALANKIVYNYLTDNKENDVLPEKMIEQYKSDFYINEKKTIIETKCIFSTEEEITIPNSLSNRAIEQLDKLQTLIQKDYTVEYYFVIFHNHLKSITIDENTRYGKLLIRNKKLGMNITILQGIYNENDNSIEILNREDLVGK